MTRELAVRYIRQTNEWLNVISLVGITVSWILSFEIERIFLWMFFSTFLLDVFFFRKVLPLKADKTWVLYAVYLLFCLLVPFMQWVTGGDMEDRIFVRSLEKHLPFLAFAIVGLLGFNKRVRVRYIAYATVVSAVLMLLYITYKAGFANLWVAEHPAWLFVHAKKTYFTSHMMANVYFNVAILCAFYICTRKQERTWVRWVYGILGVLIVAGVLFSEGRTGFVSCLVILTVMITYELWQLRRWSIVAVPIVLLLSGMLVLQNKRITEDNIRHDPRMELWEAGIAMVQQQPMGYGASEGRMQYVDRVFDTMNVGFFLRQCPDPEDKYNLHVHNAWLEEAIGQGLLGALLFTLCLLLPFMVADKQRIVFLLMLSLIMGAQYFFDVADSVPYMVLSLWTIVFLRAQWDR